MTGKMETALYEAIRKVLTDRDDYDLIKRDEREVIVDELVSAVKSWLPIRESKYRLVHQDKDNNFIDEQWFKDEEKAFAAARACASPGSLSLDPGDKMVVEEHAIDVLEVFTKPEVQ